MRMDMDSPVDIDILQKATGQGTKLAISSAEKEITDLSQKPQKWCTKENEDAARHPRFLCSSHRFTQAKIHV